MIVVFFQLPKLSGPVQSISPFNTRAATAAAEVANTVEWLLLN
jgi:hypothetical protein